VSLRIGTATEAEHFTADGIPARRWLAMARNGDIPAGVAIRLGRQVRFDMDALERWLKSGGAALPGGWRREPEE